MIIRETIEPGAPFRPNRDAWWRQAAVYQVYPRSFADSNGDGIGDLAGVTERVPYLKALGIDAVWLSPFYPSALIDGGYDVDDHRAVDANLGTLSDFDDMVAALRSSGIRIIIDIVPNHTSNRHKWFREALDSPPGSLARERYLFRDGLGEHGRLPPADWTSIFGGSAWTAAGDGQWYLHYFAAEQPDLNWKNREVRDDFLRTLRFWADRGVNGFRIDVAHGLAKELPLELPSQAELDVMPRDGTHPLWDRDEVHDIYAEWRTVFNTYDPPRTAVAEAWVDPSRRVRYARAEGLGQAFNFDLLEADFEAESFRRIVTFNLDLAAQSGSSTTWVLSNHDVVRHATRYGLPPLAGRPDKQGREWLLSGGEVPILDSELGLRRALAATLFELALPGSSYLFQGEELGLHEVASLPPASRQDPVFYRNPGVDIGRDGCRIPMPWTRSGPSFGFSSQAAHLPQPASFGRLSVEVQGSDAGSTLSLYRSALALRQRLQCDESLEWLQTSADAVLMFRRQNGWTSVTNFGSSPVVLPVGEVLISSAPLEHGFLPGSTTAWLITSL
ncbi:glycoside hydrolase family 13 protein [Subtercola sp. RTI3]|uniref:glycoside hydrolase family 13 protein n=1 Tax=Subtercola sp. RTI3 TaxID=3048639 RepID=UPI002B23B2FB|nr:glycoside hydrolase family 13 protein [Subtercola sp. RTI3]MEA9984243.1 glycoside hydrolase family 13 protein [Subtercola sp. RTI3]